MQGLSKCTSEKLRLQAGLSQLQGSNGKGENAKSTPNNQQVLSPKSCSSADDLSDLEDTREAMPVALPSNPIPGTIQASVEAIINGTERPKVMAGAASLSELQFAFPSQSQIQVWLRSGNPAVFGEGGGQRSHLLWAWLTCKFKGRCLFHPGGLQSERSHRGPERSNADTWGPL